MNTNSQREMLCINSLRIVESKDLTRSASSN